MMLPASRQTRVAPRPWLLRRTPAGLITYSVFACVFGCFPHAVANETGSEPYHDDWRWIRVGTESGLPSKDVVDLVESADGTPWLVTEGGLCWYDGFRWRTAEIGDDAEFNRATRIAVDARDRIVVLSRGRIFRGDRSGFSRVQIPDAEHQGVYVLSAVPMREDQLMVHLRGGVMLLWDEGRTQNVALPPEFPPPPENTPRLVGLRDRSAWLIGSAGAYRWLGDRWEKRLDHNANDLRADDAGNVLAVVWDPLQRGVWTGNAGKALSNIETHRGFVATTLDVAANGDAIVVQMDGNVLARRDGEWSTLTPVPRELVSARLVRFRRNGDLWSITPHGLYVCRRSLKRWTRRDVGQRRGAGAESGLVPRRPDRSVADRRVHAWNERTGVGEEVDATAPRDAGHVHVGLPIRCLQSRRFESRSDGVPAEAANGGDSLPARPRTAGPGGERAPARMSRNHLSRNGSNTPRAQGVFTDAPR